MNTRKPTMATVMIRPPDHAKSRSFIRTSFNRSGLLAPGWTPGCRNLADRSRASDLCRQSVLDTKWAYLFDLESPPMPETTGTSALTERRI
jgi:hypothetical protein